LLAALFGADDNSAGKPDQDPTLGSGEIPGGSTIMEAPSLTTEQPKVEEKKKEEPKKDEKQNTVNAAEAILKKYMSRPRKPAK
jgi:hypothetical protein